MEIIDKDIFAQMCYQVLLDHHGEGYKNAHPNYIEEKFALRRMGYNAILSLDPQNIRHVINWVRRWGYDVPDIVKKYLSERGIIV
jgi:hypothetical protein